MTRIYEHIEFPESSQERPFVVCNMVCTIDGKIVSGNRNEGVMDLGTSVDHQALRDLESHADAVLIGGQTLRTTKGIWYPDRLWKIVLTQTGNLPWKSRFFTDDLTRAIVIAPSATLFELPLGVNRINLESNSLNRGQGRIDPEGISDFSPESNEERLRVEDSTTFSTLEGCQNSEKTGCPFRDLLTELRKTFGIERLLLEGGSETNAAFFKEDLIDELFLTIAPSIKLGRETPTIAGGEPLPRDSLLNFKLIQNQTVGDEVFLRYRRNRC